MIEKYNLLYIYFISHLIVIGYNFDPLNLSSDPLIIVGRIHCTHSNNFQNVSLNVEPWLEKIVAAFRGVHASPAKHSLGKCDR